MGSIAILPRLGSCRLTSCSPSTGRRFAILQCRKVRPRLWLFICHFLLRRAVVGVDIRLRDNIEVLHLWKTFLQSQGRIHRTILDVGNLSVVQKKVGQSLIERTDERVSSCQRHFAEEHPPSTPWRKRSRIFGHARSL